MCFASGADVRTCTEVCRVRAGCTSCCTTPANLEAAERIALPYDLLCRETPFCLGYAASKLERLAGNAPASSVWKTEALLLDESRSFKLGRSGEIRTRLNLFWRQAPFQSGHRTYGGPSGILTRDLFSDSEAGTDRLPYEAALSCQRTGWHPGNRTPMCRSRIYRPTFERDAIKLRMDKVRTTGFILAR